MTKRPAYDDASEIKAEEGEVLVDGPDGVAVSLTPEAAAETSDRMMEGAALAAGQRFEKGSKNGNKQQG